MEEFTETYNRLIQVYLDAIEDDLTKGIARLQEVRLNLLHEMLAYHMGWLGEGAGPGARGKRLRPLLVLLVCGAAGGDWRLALPAASAVELVHNFSLIHDDIEDNSPLRRGRKTLWKIWGIPQAINAGDAMFSLAHLELLRLENGLSPKNVARSTKLLQQTCFHLTQGQFLDLSYESKSKLNLDDYWQMISGKTAALIATCSELGALIAGTDINRQRQYKEFGHLLGLAFQVQDDILGVWGNAELTGKSNESDLVTGKKSLPVLYGLQKNGVFARRWLKGAIISDEVINVANMLEEEGGRTYCQRISEGLTHQALDALELAHPGGNSGHALRHLVDILLHRVG